MYRTLADLVLVLHAGVVLLVVGGLLFVLVGNALGWRWVNAFWFRVAHLLAIVVVALQVWAGVVCPLTTLESWLRVQGGSTGYDVSFIGHWLQRLLFYTAPNWVFTFVYTAFGSVVAATWWYFPPRRSSKNSTVLPK
jgi:polyferredoxin